MRRSLALVVAALLAGGVAAPAAAVAQTRPPDPVRAVQKQLRQGHGVRISELAAMIDGTYSTAAARIRGQVQLSPKGPVAYDATGYSILVPYDDQETSWRAALGGADWDDITYVGGVTYTHEPPGSLPDGKSWIRWDWKAPEVAVFSHQAINVFDERVLRTLLRGVTGKAVSGGYVYRGVVSHKRLGLPPTGDVKDEIHWSLWTDAKGLPTRLRTTDLVYGREPKMGLSYDTRFLDWGFPLVVTAPPADQVIDSADV
ncbi:hypothetical protein FDA94_31525 [Herbidospora galbida]|uniref:LppX_LprAFG lipoprotein n=1 Tax=Herbidospora galbida TaxID=2575442 RepID=A0A4U3M5B2_9ACTN|nr:hypothetical protein [Herbidospora galbida]TKK84058.1 hypothetical protein FDA94_31525 [Herbidospora galbida]